MRDATQEAELQALMSVMKARDLGQIKKRNILKMDRKVNCFIRSYLNKEGAAHQVCLADEFNLKGSKKLPQPFKEADRTKSNEKDLSNEQRRWLRNPAEILNEERNRMHSFLLLKFDDIPIGTTPFNPIPFTMEEDENETAAQTKGAARK